MKGNERTHDGVELPTTRKFEDGGKSREEKTAWSTRDVEVGSK